LVTSFGEKRRLHFALEETIILKTILSIELFELWVYLAHNKDKWWAFVSMVVDFKGFTKCRKFLEHQSEYWFLKIKSYMEFVQF
jgi:hypothetical protein